MNDSLVYCRRRTPVGVKIEEVTGGEDLSAKVAEQMSRQIWCEYGKDEYRDLGHYPNGAPFMYDSDERISISHTRGMYVVATLPPTPDVDLSVFSPETSIGVDTEQENREKVVTVRSKFLSEKELAMISKDDVAANVIAWTAKEALYKASFIEGLDFATQIQITALPDLKKDGMGKAIVLRPEGEEHYNLYSYVSEGCIVTIALDVNCKTYLRKKD